MVFENSDPSSQKRQCVFITNASHLPSLWEMFTVQFENLMKPRHTPCGENAGFFSSIADGTSMH